MKRDTKRTLVIFQALARKTRFLSKAKGVLIFGLGLLIAALGFLYLWRGSLTAAPILIIGGYLVMIISLIPFKSKKR